MASFLDGVKKVFSFLLSGEEKLATVIQTGVQDAPATMPAVVDFYSKSMALATSTALCVNEKGLVIAQDTQEWQTFLSWKDSLISLSHKIHLDYTDVQAKLQQQAAAKPTSQVAQQPTAVQQQPQLQPQPQVVHQPQVVQQPAASAFEQPTNQPRNII